jgi:hypothetical protein
LFGWEQWLRIGILATLEAEIRKIAVGGQSRQKVCKTSSQTIKTGVVVHTCHPSCAGNINKSFTV